MIEPVVQRPMRRIECSTPRQTIRPLTRSTMPSGSATARKPRAISICRRKATTASVPKVISVAFTTRWYSTVPVPMLRSRRDLVADRATSQTAAMAALSDR
jgi:hypothetical protein